MPNWNHNTLTVTGAPEELERFVETARPSKAMLTEAWEGLRRDPEDEGLPSLEDFIAYRQAEHPLSFESLVPEPSDEEYAAMDEEIKTTCRLCGGRGKRPVTQEEADEWGVEFYAQAELPVLPLEERRDCNGCEGSGRSVQGLDSWYTWRVAHWGSKWDASFSGPFSAIVADGADVDASVDAQGATLTEQVAIYKFDTAWSPPIPFVQAASERFLELNFNLTFGEPGNGFAGRIVFEAGICQEEVELEVEDVLAPEEFWY